MACHGSVISFLWIKRRFIQRKAAAGNGPSETGEPKPGSAHQVPSWDNWKKVGDPQKCTPAPRQPATTDGSETKGMKEAPKLELRQAVASDASAIRELTRAAYAKWVPVIGREPKPMTANYAEAVRSHRIDLLYVDGKLAGVIEIIPEANHLLIENVAVSPAFQGQGLGRKLMVRAEHVALSLGHDEIRLYTNKLFAENVELYRKLGYRVDREEAFTGGVAVHMSKSL
jgi:ribosomal protein S18 acetylase RimI-like enzyme